MTISRLFFDIVMSTVTNTYFYTYICKLVQPIKNINYVIISDINNDIFNFMLHWLFWGIKSLFQKLIKVQNWKRNIYFLKLRSLKIPFFSTKYLETSLSSLLNIPGSFYICHNCSITYAGVPGLYKINFETFRELLGNILFSDILQ